MLHYATPVNLAAGSQVNGSPIEASVAGAGLTYAAALFQPMNEVYPAAEITTDAYGTAAQTYDSGVTHLWNATGKWNTQGQHWTAVDGADMNAGAKNLPTDRLVSGVAPPHLLDFDFVIDCDRFDLILNCFDIHDTIVWMEHGGRMKKLKDRPLTNTPTGVRYRNIKLAGTGRANWKQRRVRIRVGGTVGFVGIRTEAAARVYPAPDSHLAVLDGDSYTESLFAYNAGSDETYCCGGVPDFLCELTGWKWPTYSQGGTGYFQNGSATTTTTDAAGPNNSSRWGSAQRKAKMAVSMAQKPLFVVFNGTINDGALSGGTATMKARAKVVYSEALALDTVGLCSVVQVTPEPYNDGYTAGGVHDQNRLGQIAAVGETARAYYLDASDPANPWWTGTGSNNSPTNSKQAAGTGGDGLHGNYRGYLSHAKRIADGIARLPVPISRANREE